MNRIEAMRDIRFGLRFVRRGIAKLLGLYKEPDPYDKDEYFKLITNTLRHADQCNRAIKQAHVPRNVRKDQS